MVSGMKDFIAFSMEKELCMNDSKVLAFIFGLIPMTLIQYFYWNWVTDALINGINISLKMFLFIPIVVALLYCVYERFVIFSVIYVNTTFYVRIPLVILWILESVIAAIVSNRIVYNYEKHDIYKITILNKSALCLVAGFVLIISFLFCRIFLYKKRQ